MDKTSKEKHSRYPNNPIKPADSCGSPVYLNCPTRNDLSFDCSPILSQCTIDNYDVDVIWDWNSPRAKTNVARRGKRQHTSEQEKPPLKKTPSGNHLPTFDKLKKKLDALKEELTAEKRNEKAFSSLPVDFDCSTNRQINHHNRFMEDIPELEDLFNDDSFEEQLILCSQNVESNFIIPSEGMKIKTNECASKGTGVANNINIDISKPKKFNFKPSNKAPAGSLKDIFDLPNPKPSNLENKANKPMEDDSFDSVLAVFETDDMELLNEIDTKQSNTKQDCFNDNKSKCLETGIKPSSRSPQFRKTASFDDSFLKPKSITQCESLPKETLAEIERKRKEALAKLEAKRKAPHFAPVETSLLKSSMEQSKTTQIRFKEGSKCLETGIKQLPKSPQFKKTTSFDDSLLKSGSSRQDVTLSKETLEEIERKRKEALARLEAKRKTPHAPPVDETSPIKCSPEEIEQKRLQALAKREAKRKQEIIERNRLEALKRLEINKKKKALELQNAHRTAPKTLPYSIARNDR